MKHYIPFSDINKVVIQSQLKMASVIVADDGDAEALLFSNPSLGGFVTVIEFPPGEVLFETSDFFQLCRTIKSIKGGCSFNIERETRPVEVTDTLEPTNRISETLSLEEMIDLLDDDDDPSNWWKRGAN